MFTVGQQITINSRKYIVLEADSVAEADRFGNIFVNVQDSKGNVKYAIFGISGNFRKWDGGRKFAEPSRGRVNMRG